MFEYIKGIFTESASDKITVEVNGLGYRVWVSLSSFANLPQIGSEIKLYVSVVIREDSHKVYGFLTREERNFFETLNDISGIGPRLSIAILGHMRLEDFLMAIHHSNAKAIFKIPGIGKKMAERLILELRDKSKKIQESSSLGSTSFSGSLAGDAISALTNLGYGALDAQKAVQAALDSQEEEPSLPGLISLALKK